MAATKRTTERAKGRQPQGLTERRAQVLEVIRQFTAVHGFSPTYREIGQGLKPPIDGQPNAILGHLQALERLGYITRVPGRASSIHIVEPAPVG